ncbi:hypothetical protein VN97_g2214 [Penicillium thymicola]|uniref:HNH nuclease domain-containing protein n=1 Tax=Penicillium thymicola TaxID=293382 RepID=A0AAI9TPI6_PENTH|nr:hypothetical protein VN97_g2214 [Penicillium thymicola]
MVGTEQVSNLITLDMQTHEYWDRANFAFRPVWINRTKTEMHVAFHWLPFVKDGPLEILVKRTELVPTEEFIFNHPYYRPTMDPGKNNILFHTQTLKPILSGHVFKITTDDPKARPLPSMELLQLKWNLSRIAAMQGGGEDEDSDDDSDGGSTFETGTGERHMKFNSDSIQIHFSSPLPELRQEVANAGHINFMTKAHAMVKGPGMAS